MDTSGNQKILKCHFCGSDQLNTKWIRTDGINVNVCEKCGLGMVESFPIQQEELYGDSYYVDDSDHIGYRDYMNEVKYNYFIWAAALSKLFAPQGKKVYEIGATNGMMLEMIQKLGYNELDGCEYNKNFANIAKSKGYNVEGGDFLNLSSYKKSYYDLALGLAVLEHIPNIKESLEKTFEILNDDGVFIFEIPCMIGEKESDDVWLSTSLEHVYYFQEKSVREIVEKVFGNKCFGQVIKTPGYGGTFIGIVAKSASKTLQISTIFDQLTNPNQDFNSLSTDSLVSNLIFHTRYTNDYTLTIKNANAILDRKFLSLEIYSFAFISLRFIESIPKIAYIESQHRGLESNYQESQNKVKLLQEQIENLELNLNELRNQNNSLDLFLGEREGEIESLKGKEEELTTENNFLNEEIRNFKNTNAFKFTEIRNSDLPLHEKIPREIYQLVSLVSPESIRSGYRNVAQKVRNLTRRDR